MSDIDDSIPSDPAMDNLLEPYQLEMNEALNLTQVYANVPCSTNQSTGSTPSGTGTRNRAGRIAYWV